MTTREDYPAGVPCWADTNQPEPASAAQFYASLFGWDTEDVMPPGADGQYFMGRIGGRDAAAISSQPPGAPPPAWNTYIRVESADETAAKVRDAGGTVLAEPFDVLDSGRMAVVADPEGAAFSVWQPRLHRGAAAVNEHGAVNFNNLHTGDLARAEEFYHSVFGWTTLIDGGQQFWTLPGYGDHLETLVPGMRASMRQMGAPEGFEDAVAMIMPRDGEPARWSVTFGVDDADAIAARAKELGGSVVAPPQNAPWIRFTVLADPAGATFTASQFVPESR